MSSSALAVARVPSDVLYALIFLSAIRRRLSAIHKKLQHESNAKDALAGWFPAQLVGPAL